MNVYIKGMEMPTNCCQCPVNMEICKRGYKYLLEHPELYDKRADDCPLAPVPKHGDLIDGVALRAEVKKHATPSDAWVFSLIRTAPIIIPADKEAGE
jgi:hypothetical protein